MIAHPEHPDLTVPPTIRVASPDDLVTLIPYLIGHHPVESLCALAIAGSRVTLSTRTDLPTDPTRDQPLARSLIRPLVRAGAEQVILLGYGDPAHVHRVIDTTMEVLESEGLPVAAALRVHDHRYWILHPQAGPPGGMPYDPQAAPAAAAVAAGLVARPSRANLAATIAPETGPARQAMIAATGNAIRGFRDTLAPDPRTARARLAAHGAGLLPAAVSTYRGGRRLADHDAAELSVLMDLHEVRDRAVAAVQRADIAPYLALWTDMTRRAVTGLAACATTLAYTAWQAGDGTLANLALERAQTTQPGYRLAALLRAALDAGLPPQTCDLSDIADELPPLGLPT